MFDLYMNARGKPPMRYVRTLDPAQLGLSESDATQAIETAVLAMNELEKEIESQVVIVQDGLIVAVEGLTTGKLIWTN